MSQTARIDLYTTPDSASGAPRTALLEMIAGAKHTIDFGIFAFTSLQVADAIVAAVARRVKVRGVMDATQSVTPGNRYAYLVSKGVDVRLFGHQRQLMHDKVLLVDVAHPRSAALALGSYNWTAGAEDSNRELLAVLRGTSVSRSLGPTVLEQLSLAYEAGRS